MKEVKRDEENGIKYQSVAGHDIEEKGGNEEELLEGSQGFTAQDVKRLLRHLRDQLIRSDCLKTGQCVSIRQLQLIHSNI